MVKHSSSPFPARNVGRRLNAVVGILLCSMMLVGTAWGQSPRPGTHPLTARHGLHVSTADRCPVCAMRPIKSPRFAAALQMQDGTTFYFCSAGCMLKAWLRPDVFLKARPGDLKKAVAQDYFSGQPVDAQTVFWISGSDVIGPMGPALVPLEQTAHVEAFRRRHGLTHVFRMEDLTLDNWEDLTGKPFRF